MTRTLHIIPSKESACEIMTIGNDSGSVLPKIGVRAFEHALEFVVVDLAGNPVHTIVVRQNGDVGVDE